MYNLVINVYFNVGQLLPDEIIGGKWNIKCSDLNTPMKYT